MPTEEQLSQLKALAIGNGYNVEKRLRRTSNGEPGNAFHIVSKPGRGLPGLEGVQFFTEVSAWMIAAALADLQLQDLL